MEVSRCTYPLLNEEVYRAQLSSGLRVIVVPRPGFSKAYAVFMTHYGSNDSSFVVPGANVPITVPDGIAHFLEHQLFAKEWGDAFTKFSEWGANANAFTAWTYTGYVFSTTSNFLDCLGFLVDFVQDPYFTEKGTEKEKGIIEQEIRMYQDDPNWRVYFNLLSAMYQNHPVRKDIAGTVESVRSITKELLDDCYNTFYHPSNMVLVVVGDVEPGEVIAAADNKLKEKGFRPQGEINRLYPEEPAENRQSEVSQKLAVTVPLFALGFKDVAVGETGEGLLKKQLTTDLLLQAFLGKSSELFNSLYNDGFIGLRFSLGYSGQPDYGYTIIQGESRDPQAVRDRILTDLQKLLQNGISQERFELGCKVLLGEFLRQLNSVESLANSIADNSFNEVDYLQLPEILDSITLADVNERLRQCFAVERAVLSTVMPS